MKPAISEGSRSAFRLALLCLFSASPASAEFNFRHHYIDRDLPGDSYGQTCLVDVDRDGDLDFITGGRDAAKSIYWFEFAAPDRWTRHLLGTNHLSDVGGTAIDIDGDGWLDHVSGGVWYRNTGRPRAESFDRIVFDKDLAAVHDLVAADLDGDRRIDIISMSDRNNLRWYRLPKDARQPWERHDIGPGVHAGVAVGDIDGDGDPDIARSNLWFENVDGKAAKWAEHPIPFGKPVQPYPLATRCVIVDINRDGHNDLVMTENEIRAGRIAWLENADGTGNKWKVHDLPPADTGARGAYHSLAVADFDKDDDLDVFTVEMEAIPGARLPRWFIWENVDGKGTRFVERVILDAGLGGHEAVAADVDRDGDIDICSKLWRPRQDNANGGRNHADYLENLSVKRAAAVDKPGLRCRCGMKQCLVLVGVFTCGGWLGAERINHEGRILGPEPVVAAPILFHTTEADAVVSAMQIMPRDNPWNEDISRRPILPASAAMIAQVKADLAAVAANRQTLRPFYEMNYVLVPADQPRVDIGFCSYRARP